MTVTLFWKQEVDTSRIPNFGISGAINQKILLLKLM